MFVLLKLRSGVIWRYSIRHRNYGWPLHGFSVHDDFGVVVIVVHDVRGMGAGGVGRWAWGALLEQFVT